MIYWYRELDLVFIDSRKCKRFINSTVEFGGVANLFVAKQCRAIFAFKVMCLFVHDFVFFFIFVMVNRK